MFWYLATPYTKYPGGIAQAHVAACKQLALFVKAGIPAFSPIVHTHEVALFGEIDPIDHELWLAAELPFMAAAGGLILCKLPSWELSHGMRFERDAFVARHLPVVEMEPGVIPALPCLSKIK